MKILPTVLISTSARCFQKTFNQRSQSILRNEYIYKRVIKENTRCYHCSNLLHTRKNNGLKQLSIPAEKLARTNTPDDENLLRTNNRILDDNDLDEIADEDERDREFRRRTRKPPGTHKKSGAIKNRPVVNRHAPLNALLLIGLFVYLGGQLSSAAARLLSDYEIFTPEEDDEWAF